MERRKNNFFEAQLVQLEGLEKTQTIYKKSLNAIRMPKEAKETVKFEQAIEHLRKERNDLRAQIWLANSGSNKRKDQQYLGDLECHVDCQEHLSQDIEKLRDDISNIERTLQHTEKKICALNRRTVPEAQHMRHVAHFRKKMEMLENQVEGSIRLECIFRAQNAKLRTEIINLLEDRQIFDKVYTKLMQRLSNDKKYLTDLIDHALDKFEDCLDLFDKMQSVTVKQARDTEKLRTELEHSIRQVETDKDTQMHMETKQKPRDLADLLPKENVRRDKVTTIIVRKINLYNKVMKNITEFTKSNQLKSIIDSFKEQESLYYSYFNYSNEICHHITLIDHAVNNLTIDMKTLLADNRAEVSAQWVILDELDKALKQQQKRNINFNIQLVAQKLQVQNMLDSIHEIFDLCRADASPLFSSLGDHSHVHLVNVPRVLKILEQRIYNITAGLYVLERLDESMEASNYTVKHLHKLRIWPTAIDDIVLTQQCPECAESDILNVDEVGDAAVNVVTAPEVRKKLREKVVQPEMQYRLHSIEECKLPRSRLLATRKST